MKSRGPATCADSHSFPQLDRSEIGTNGSLFLPFSILPLLQKLEEKDIHLLPSEELIDHISTTGFDPQFGARPIKRMIQKELLNELSRQIIAGTLETGVPQVIDVFDGNIVLRRPIEEEDVL